jgi:hypothetical protein
MVPMAPSKNNRVSSLSARLKSGTAAISSQKLLVKKRRVPPRFGSMNRFGLLKNIEKDKLKLYHSMPKPVLKSRTSHQRSYPADAG